MEMIARLVSVKLPSGDEGQKPIARFELHDREGERGQLLLPYDDKMGSLGSVFRVNIENFERISVKDYLDILPLGIRIKGDTTEFPGVF
jgi:hypothetical protein